MDAAAPDRRPLDLKSWQHDDEVNNIHEEQGRSRFQWHRAGEETLSVHRTFKSYNAVPSGDHRAQCRLYESDLMFTKRPRPQ